MSNEIAKLYLSTYHLPTINDNNSFDFLNINLRTIIGNDMFNKYDTFNISLQSIFSGATSSTYLNQNADSFVNIVMSGLPFLNSTYDYITKNNTSETHLVTYEFPLKADFTQSNVFYYTNKHSGSADFQRPSGNVDINIRLASVITNEKAFSLNPFPQMNFFFTITGVLLSDHSNSIQQAIKIN